MVKKKITKDFKKEKYDYIGNFVNGKKNGFGKEYFDFESIQMLVYEGEFKDDKRNGFGKE